ncbi:hypothetical protein H4R33_000719 [Dimargaris cristalligena]|nr:hypothetical protein H4R33_000719 [Dimargaris cristalligena]
MSGPGHPPVHPSFVTDPRRVGNRNSGGPPSSQPPNGPGPARVYSLANLPPPPPTHPGAPMLFPGYSTQTTRLACESCMRHGLLCDGQLPACLNCTITHTACVPLGLPNPSVHSQYSHPPQPHQQQHPILQSKLPPGTSTLPNSLFVSSSAPFSSSALLTVAVSEPLPVPMGPNPMVHTGRPTYPTMPGSSLPAPSAYPHLQPHPHPGPSASASAGGRMPRRARGSGAIRTSDNRIAKTAKNPTLDYHSKYQESVRTIEGLESRINDLRLQIGTMYQQASAMGLDRVTGPEAARLWPISAVPPGSIKPGLSFGGQEEDQPLSSGLNITPTPVGSADGLTSPWVMLPPAAPVPRPLNNNHILLSDSIVMHLCRLHFQLTQPFDFITHHTVLQILQERRQRQPTLTPLGPSHVPFSIHHSGSDTESPSLFLCSLFALMAHYSDHPYFQRDSPYRAGQEYFEHAKAHILQSLEENRMVNVLTLFLLMRYELAQARNQNSWMYLGLALRLAQRLNLNRSDTFGPLPAYPTPNMSWAQLEVKRRIWWMIYSMDINLSIVGGRPPSVYLEDCQLDFASDDLAYISSLQAADQAQTQAKAKTQSGSSQPADHSLLSPSILADYDLMCRESNSRSSPSLQYYAISLVNVTCVLSQMGNKLKNGVPLAPTEFDDVYQALWNWKNQLPPTIASSPGTKPAGWARQYPMSAASYTQSWSIYNSALVFLHLLRVAQLYQISYMNATSADAEVRAREGIGIARATPDPVAIRAVRQQYLKSAWDLVTVLNSVDDLDVRYLSPIMTYCILQIALVFILNLQSLHEYGGGDGGEDGPSDRADDNSTPNRSGVSPVQCTEALNMARRFLKRIAKYWPIGWWCLRIMTTLESNIQSIQVIASRNKPSTASISGICNIMGGRGGGLSDGRASQFSLSPTPPPPPPLPTLPPPPPPGIFSHLSGNGDNDTTYLTTATSTSTSTASISSNHQPYYQFQSQSQYPQTAPYLSPTITTASVASSAAPHAPSSHSGSTGSLSGDYFARGGNPNTDPLQILGALGEFADFGMKDLPRDQFPAEIMILNVINMIFSVNLPSPPTTDN